MKEATTWMEHLSHLWDDRFSRLDAHLAAMKALQADSTDTQETDKEEDPDHD